MPTPQQLLAQAGRKPQDLSRANAATGTLQGANGGTQQLGEAARRRLAQLQQRGGVGGESPPIMAPLMPPSSDGQVGRDIIPDPATQMRTGPLPASEAGTATRFGDPSTAVRSMTGGGLQAPMMNAVDPNSLSRPLPPDLAQVQGLDIMGIPPGAGVGSGGFNLPGFKPAGDPLGVRPLPTTTNFDMGRQDPATATRPQPGAALGGVMPPPAGKLPSPGGNPAGGWSVGGPPASPGGPDVRPPIGLPGFKPADPGMQSKPVTPGLPPGDPPQQPSMIGRKPRTMPGRNSMAGF